MIVASYDRLEHLGCEAVVFLDTESGECFQIQRDLPGLVTSEQVPTYQLTTGVSAPIPTGIVEWRRVGPTFEFALTPRAARIFGGADLLSFDVSAADGHSLDDIADHVTRLVR